MNHRPVATIFLAAALTALVGWRVHTTTSHVLPWPELTITTQETAAPGYDRSCRPGRGCVFGPDWHDDNTAAWGHDGCDQLNQLRARDLTAPTFKSARSCKVTGGTLTQDPYIAADRNVPWTDTSGDHVIPLHVAWDRGAHTWPLERRRAFANDPDNLILTTRRTNSSKGDQTPATWHPETHLGRCRYATAWVTTAGRYNIPVTPLENQRIHTMCPGGTKVRAFVRWSARFCERRRPWKVRVPRADGGMCVRSEQGGRANWAASTGGRTRLVR